MSSDDRTDRLSRLFQANYGLVMGVADRFAPSPDCVDDIAQQVYVDFVYGPSAARWNLDANVAPLLYRITKNKALLLWRERRRASVAVDEVFEQLFYTDADSEEYETTTDWLKHLDRCLARLNDNSRRLVERHYYEGESIKQIGERESVKLPAIYRFFRKIRQKLKECIEQSLQTKPVHDS